MSELISKIVLLEDYLMGRATKWPLSEELKENANDIVCKLCELQDAYGHELIITSGYRPPQVNAGIHGARPNDAHTTCRGVDLRDTDARLSHWCLQNMDVLTKIGFWLESPISSRDHVHLQTYAPKSGRRVFIA